MDQRKTSPSQKITQESNQAYLRQHQNDLRQNYPSCDMSEVSYQTEQTEFPGSRHSSLNTEPLTLDSEQMHDAKDQAVDVLQHAGPDKAVDIFTKDFESRSEAATSQESEAEALKKQINSLVEKAQQVVEANEKHTQSMSKIPGAPTSSFEQSNAPAQTLEKVPSEKGTNTEEL